MTSSSPGAVADALIKRFAAGTLPAFVAAWVEKRVHSDAAWSARYHELRIGERALENVPLSSSQLDRISASVLKSPAKPRAQTRPWLALAGAGVCAAVVLVVVTRPPQQRDDLHVRGSTTIKAGVHVRCVDAARRNVLAEADVRAGGRMKCPATGLLAFSVTNTSAEEMAITGSGYDGTKRVFTLPLEGDAATVAPHAVDAPLLHGFPLDAASGVHELKINASVYSTKAKEMERPQSEVVEPTGFVVEVTP